MPQNQINPFAKIDAIFSTISPSLGTATVEETLEYLIPLLALKFMQLEGVMKTGVIKISKNGYKNATCEYLDVYNCFNRSKGTEAKELPKKTGSLEPKNIENSPSLKSVIDVMSPYLGFGPNVKMYEKLRNWVAHGAFSSQPDNLYRFNDYQPIKRAVDAALAALNNL